MLEIIKLLKKDFDKLSNLEKIFEEENADDYYTVKYNNLCISFATYDGIGLYLKCIENCDMIFISSFTKVYGFYISTGKVAFALGGWEFIRSIEVCNEILLVIAEVKITKISPKHCYVLEVIEIPDVILDYNIISNKIEVNTLAGEQVFFM